MQSIILREEVLDFKVREAFRTLCMNVEFSSSDVRSVAITSCTPNEGKSEISIHLARSLAENGRKVLLVDGDLRKSDMKRNHKSGKVRLGLSHFLIGRNSLDEVTCQTDIPNFYMIFAGPLPPNPGELLASRYFARLLAEGSELYDYIIVDTPPLESVNDSVIIAKQCDGVALVLQSGAISYRFAQKATAQLRLAGCKVLGCILNKVRVEKKE